MLILITFLCRREERDNRTLIEKLNDLPDVTAIFIDPVYEYPKQFKLKITQPLDHNNPKGPTFVQEAYLYHLGEGLPMVFGPSGYGVFEKRKEELGGILGANMLMVSHRYFEGSEPDPWVWEHLNIKQAAADHHRIVEMLKEIYKGVWVSSGVSKGGTTALYHKRYYPDDVDATVAYVAPILFSQNDERFITFLENVGTEACREAQKAFERRLLEQRDSLIPKFVNYFADYKLSLSMDPELAYEWAVRDYHWNFWQFHDVTCKSIPSETASLNEMFNHFWYAGKIWLFADSYQAYYSPSHYQALTEKGRSADVTAHLHDLLEVATDMKTDLYFFDDVNCSYDPSVIRDIDRWLKAEGDNIIYIYGEYDPWSAAMFEPGEGTNAFRIIQPGADHTVRIEDLDEESRVLDSLEVWLGVEID